MSDSSDNTSIDGSEFEPNINLEVKLEDISVNTNIHPVDVVNQDRLNTPILESNDINKDSDNENVNVNFVDKIFNTISKTFGITFKSDNSNNQLSYNATSTIENNNTLHDLENNNTLQENNNTLQENSNITGSIFSNIYSKLFNLNNDNVSESNLVDNTLDPDIKIPGSFILNDNSLVNVEYTDTVVLPVDTIENSDITPDIPLDNNTSNLISEDIVNIESSKLFNDEFTILSSIDMSYELESTEPTDLIALNTSPEILITGVIEESIESSVNTTTMMTMDTTPPAVSVVLPISPEISEVSSRLTTPIDNTGNINLSPLGSLGSSSRLSTPIESSSLLVVERSNQPTIDTIIEEVEVQQVVEQVVVQVEESVELQVVSPVQDQVKDQLKDPSNNEDEKSIGIETINSSKDIALPEIQQTGSSSEVIVATNTFTSPKNTALPETLQESSYSELESKGLHEIVQENIESFTDKDSHTSPKDIALSETPQESSDLLQQTGSSSEVITATNIFTSPQNIALPETPQESSD
jgi:hypothetical protein